MLGNLTSFLGKRVSETLPPEEWLTLARFFPFFNNTHIYSAADLADYLVFIRTSITMIKHGISSTLH